MSGPTSWTSPQEALNALADQYRLDRTKGQKEQVWFLYEKATLSAQIQAWTEEYGLPTAALRGYSSESLEAEIFVQMQRDGRDARVFYIGDLDPEGEDIERNFLAQADRMGIVLDEWTKLTVLPAQVASLGLVPNPGKASSSRAAGFVARHGRLFQIEVEAVDPAELQRLVVDAVDTVLDRAVYDDLKTKEDTQIAQLKQVAEDWEDDED